MNHLAYVHLADVSSMAPLQYAATSNFVVCLKILLNAGAGLSAKEHDRGWTTLYCAAFHRTDPSRHEDLHHGTALMYTIAMRVCKS